MKTVKKSSSDTIYADNYSLLITLFPLTTLSNNHLPFLKHFSNITLSFQFLEENDYFSLYLLSEFGKVDAGDMFDEVMIRVWKDKKAEVISLRQAQFDSYEEVYKKRNGIEFQQPIVKNKANQFLFEWFQRISARV